MTELNDEFQEFIKNRPVRSEPVIVMTFDISEDESAIADTFLKEHPCKLWRRRKVRGVKRGESYRFTETGIGCGVDVICACGKEKDITDYGSW